MKTNNFHKQIKKYFILVNRDMKTETKKNISNKILLHVLKANYFVLIIIFFYFKIITVFSIIFIQKRFEKLSFKDLKKIQNFFFIVKFIPQKIDNLFLVIPSLHNYGDEIVKKRKIINYSEDLFFPFIVVGSGPSGFATASKLSDVFPGKVAILEKGDFYQTANTKHPGDEFFKKWDKGGLNTTFWNDQVSFSSGMCVGGGSEINSGLYHSPDSLFLDQWSSDYGIKNTSLENLRPYIKKVDKFVNEDINPQNREFEKNFIQGAKELNLKFTKLKRFISKNGNSKNTMTKIFLNKFLSNKGSILPNHEVSNLFFDGTKWVINVSVKKKKKIMYCDYLFLCCGAIHTNQLILKSNIIKKNKETLKKFKFHPMIKSLAVYPKKVQELNTDISPYQITDFYPNYIIGNAASSIQFQLLPFLGNKKVQNFIFNHWKNTRIIHTTFSLGKGELCKFYPNGEFVPTYSFNKLDKNLISKGFYDQVRFIKATGAKTILPAKNNFSYPISLENMNDDNYEIISKKGLQFSSVHIMGGVTSGEKDNCVVDSYGKVKDVENLYVNDSSLINNDLLKNPQGTVLVITLRNIEHFLDTLNYK